MTKRRTVKKVKLERRGMREGKAGEWKIGKGVKAEKENEEEE
jgi:hypothetical protein